MALILQGGDDAFRALAYQPPHPNVAAYVQRHNQGWNAGVSEHMNAFLSAAGSVYNRVSHSDAIRMVRAIAGQVSTMWQPNSVQYLNTLPKLQNAMPSMQRWLMANPYLRELARAQRCDGYAETYVDMFPRAAPTQHPDYLLAIDGLYMEQEDGTTTVTCLMGDVDHPDDVLTYAEQTDILDSWDLQTEYLKAQKEDPTSKYKAML
jgi:hypothetical protein